MTEERMIVITPEKTERWVITKTELNIEDSIKEQFATGIHRTSYNVVDLTPQSDGYFAGVHMRVHSETQTSWTIQIRKIKLNAPFVNHDGIFVPMFDDKDAPRLHIDWVPPSSMNLTLTVVVNKRHGSAHAGSFFQYLVARDAQRRSWRMPISNLFDDLKLCSGMDEIRADTQAAVIKIATDQFINSSWNQDLYNSGDGTLKSKTRCMFRFKPSNDGFEQLPVLSKDEDWTLLCDKVATEEIERYVV